MFPIETNADKPRPRDSVASSNASPSAPLWEEKPMFPGGAAREANVALSRTAADEMPRQLGPQESGSVRANRCEQGPLAFLAFRADLREPRGDHTDSPNPRIEDGLDRLEDCQRRTDDGEIYGVGDVSDGAVSPNACDRLAVPIHGVCGTHVLALEDVAEELASDRAPARRGAEHRDGLRLEERTERRDDRSVITFLDERCVTDGGSDRERHLDLPPPPSSRHFEAHSFEDLDHAALSAISPMNRSMP